MNIGMVIRVLMSKKVTSCPVVISPWLAQYPPAVVNNPKATPATA